jgi:hypothetical protein
MRMVLIISLAGALAGCSCFAPPQIIAEACAEPNQFGCSYRTASATQFESDSAVEKLGPHKRKANAAHVTRASAPRFPHKVSARKPASAKKNTASAVKQHKRELTAKVTPPRPVPESAASASDPAPTKVAAAPAAQAQKAESAQADIIPDSILDKLRAAIAAKLEDPASVEFIQMKRALRKNLLEQPIDTICGHIVGKTTSSAERKEMPFLYLVKEENVYIDDGSDEAVADAYGKVCK